jgi:hypothetical protein
MPSSTFDHQPLRFGTIDKLSFQRYSPMANIKSDGREEDERLPE